MSDGTLIQLRWLICELSNWSSGLTSMKSMVSTEPVSMLYISCTSMNPGAGVIEK